MLQRGRTSDKMAKDTPKNSKESDLSKQMQFETKKANVKDLFYPKLMALWTANMFYQWFAVTLVYYGLSYSSTDLAGDP